MENEINISKEQINSFLQRFGAAKDDSSGNIEKALNNNLTSEQKEKINSVLSDPQKLNSILSSPQAKKLFDMIKDKKE